MTRLRVATALLTAAYLTLAPRELRAQELDPDKTYAAAKKQYERGSYKRVVLMLAPLLYPKTLITSRDKLIQAHKMLGISYVFEKKPVAAERSFLAILSERPKYKLDPLVDPPAAVTLFRQVKQRSISMLKKIEEAQRKEEARRRREKARREAELRRLREAAKRSGLVIERRIVTRSFWKSFVPFGVGQFQNGHRRKGYALLSAQLALGGASMGMMLATIAAYPYPTAQQDSPGRPAWVTPLLAASIVSGALFWGLVIYGVIDAVSFFEPEKVSERRYRRGPASRPAPRSKSATLRLSPSFGRRAAGLGMTLTF